MDEISGERVGSLRRAMSRLGFLLLGTRCING